MKCACIVRIKMIHKMQKISFGLYFKVEYDKNKPSDGWQFHNPATVLK